MITLITVSKATTVTVQVLSNHMGSWDRISETDEFWYGTGKQP